MKKILLLTAALILGTIATMAQTNGLSFTIYPDESGTFNIWYSTKNAPSTNVVEVNWGDGGGLETYNSHHPSGSDPTKSISGTVNRSNPVTIYSNCIEAIWIVHKVRGVRFEANNPHCQYFYYWKDNLSAASLEAFYMSLPDGSNFGWGELHLSQEENIADAGNNILKSNSFITTDKDWRICSFKNWSGTLDERHNWSLSENLAKIHLKPAIRFKTRTTANMTDLKIGIMDAPEWPWFVTRSFVRIDDGTNNYNSLEVLKYTNDQFESNSPDLTIKGTGSTGEVKIYGALVSHFKTNQLRWLFLNNIVNLRYLSATNSEYITELLGINQQKSLNYLKLTGNDKLTDINVNISPYIKTLDVQGCSSLHELWFVRTKLEFLNIAGCASLPRKKISPLSDATKLNKIYADNLGWDACDLDSFFYDLRSAPQAPGLISVDDFNFSPPPNDWAGSNKTIARDKGWDVVRWTGNWTSLYGDGGGCTTGISQAEAAKFITVFPNPATDVVNITLVPNLNAESLEVIDVTGKTIFSVPVSPTELEIQINVSDYAKGIYLIRVGHYTHKMLVK